MPTLWTAGYEGLTLNAFIANLKDAGIACLADVRKYPVSRKPGFSKPQLQTALRDADIAYYHLEPLGNPMKGRDMPPGTDYRAAYRKHLQTPAVQAALQDLLHKSQRQKTCILCFEEHPQDCHRNEIAAYMAQQFGYKIIHLGHLQQSLPLFRISQ